MANSIDSPSTLESFIIANKPRKSSESSPLPPENEEFWRGQQPQEIIIATGSVRKAFMAVYLMKGFVFPKSETYLEKEYAQFGEEPRTIHAYLDEHIFNGDGQLQEKTFLCHFEGVPVYAEPSSGETANNEPIKQARNKSIALLEEYQGKNIWIVATDTVDYPDKDGDGQRDEDSYLGKIMNHPDFSAHFDTGKLTEFLQKYLDENYPVGTQVVHHNGLALTDAATGETHDLLVKLSTQVREQLTTDTMKVFLDVGGGGIIQQLLDWKSEQLLQEVADEHGQRALAGKSHEEIQWILSTQVAGMVWWAIEVLLQEHVDRKEGREVVVFEAQTQYSEAK